MKVSLLFGSFPEVFHGRSMAVQLPEPSPKWHGVYLVQDHEFENCMCSTRTPPAESLEDGLSMLAHRAKLLEKHSWTRQERHSKR